MRRCRRCDSSGLRNSGGSHRTFDYLQGLAKHLLIIFDLDGTLIDSGKDLAISMNATREFAGMPPLDPELIYSYVGNGAATLVRRALGEGASEELAQEALQFFLKYYRAHALEHTQLYPGV